MDENHHDPHEPREGPGRRRAASSRGFRRPGASAVLLACALVAATALLTPGLRLGGHGGSSAHADDASATENPAAFLKSRCVHCHGSVEPDGDLNLEPLLDADELIKRPRLLGTMIHRVAVGEMPPPDAEEPLPQAAREAGLRRLRALLKRAHARAPEDPGAVVLRRLNRVEYDATMRDLFGVDLKLGETLPDDGLGYGFDTVGDVLALSPLLLERALDNAERIAAAALRDLKPARQRIEAEKARREGRGGTHRGFATLSTNGAFSHRFRVRHGGSWRLRIRLSADQAGPDKARFDVRVDGRRVKRGEVRSPDRKPELVETRLRLEPGRREIAVAFTNDYYNPAHRDPSERDRNLHVDWFELEGPLEPPRPTRWERRRETLLRTRTPREADRALLGELAAEAWRRPLRRGELERLMSVYEASREAGDRPLEALRVAVSAVLVSPHFLFKLEPDDPEGPAVRELSEHELAVRLSYGLWTSLPDAALREAADERRLKANLPAIARRMLADPRSSRFVEAFAGQWLQLRRVATLMPDPDRFPSFDDALQEAMATETRLVFEAILREGRPAMELLDADWTFVNERLAKHYGIIGVSGPGWQRVRAAPGRRGVLGHAGILALGANPTRSSPVKRGKWILEVLLDDPPPPPEPGSDSLPPISPEQARRMTLRQRFEAHRAKKSCAVCHDRIDPLGFALEGFDAIGARRERRGGKPVDTSGRLPGGETFRGLTGLLGQLKSRRAAILASLVRRLLIYFVGRGPRPEDEGVIARVIAEAGDNPRLDALVLGLLESELFTKRVNRTRLKAPKPSESSKEEGR